MPYSLKNFELLLERASKAAIQFARRYVSNILFDDVRYYLIPNVSYDGNPLVGDEQVYPEDSLGPHQYHEFSASEAARFLWRHGKTPEWIDISVVDVVGTTTCLELLCCGRFTADESRLYYTSGGMGPFGIKSPILPPKWDHDKPTKFTLPPYQTHF